MQKSLTTTYSTFSSFAMLSALAIVLASLFLPQQSNAQTTTQNTEASPCEDRGGYPWGWNPATLQSCRLDLVANPATTCIDTEPQGDGWGWNGVESCRITLTESVYQCNDSGHYPWGWNPTNNTSCRIDLTNITQESTDPVAYTALVNIPLMCRKIEKQNNQGVDILAQDDNLFYSTTLTPMNAPEELYTFANSNEPSAKIFTPISIDVSPWVFLYALNDDRTPSIDFLRFDQLQNGSFNVSERDSSLQWTTTSRCVVR